jgi:hypothetical protein
MTLGQGVDIKKCIITIILVNLIRRNLSIDYSGKNACHGKMIKG